MKRDRLSTRRAIFSALTCEYEKLVQTRSCNRMLTDRLLLCFPTCLLFVSKLSEPGASVPACLPDPGRSGIIDRHCARVAWSICYGTPARKVGKPAKLDVVALFKPKPSSAGVHCPEIPSSFFLMIGMQACEPYRKHK